MITIKSVYEDVALDTVDSATNGNLDFDTFNRMSRRGELRVRDFLTGDVNNEKPPIPYTSQKIKDWLSPFITPYPAQVKNGIINKPDDYYGFENMVLIGSGDSDCEEEITSNEICDIPIELLDGNKFNQRCTTDIEGLRPSLSKPIAKEIGKTFAFLPKDLGSVRLEYIRYPVFAKIVKFPELDIYHNETIDEAASTNYEYQESMRELLVYFITQSFGVKVREAALLQSNELQGKLVRDSK
jgi:hypothetical protein